MVQDSYDKEEEPTEEQKQITQLKQRLTRLENKLKSHSSDEWAHTQEQKNDIL